VTHTVVGTVFLTGVTVDEFNTDTGQQDALKTDIAAAAGTAEDRVALESAREATSDESASFESGSGSRRRLLQEGLIAIDYTIDFGGETEAGEAAATLEAIELLEELALYLAGDYEGAQVESVSAAVVAVDTGGSDSDDALLGTGGIVGVAAGGGVLLLVVVVVAARKLGAGKDPERQSSEKFYNNPNINVLDGGQLGQGGLELTSTGADSHLKTTDDDEVLPSGVV